MTSSNGNIFRVTGPLCGEFTGPGEFPTQRPVTRSFDVFFDLRLNKWLSKQPWGWWFETLSWSLWRHCNGIVILHFFIIKSAWCCMYALYVLLYSYSILFKEHILTWLVYMNTYFWWTHISILCIRNALMLNTSVYRRSQYRFSNWVRCGVHYSVCVVHITVTS